MRFDQASYTATEGGTAVTVTVTLSADPERTVTVDLEVTAGGGATAGDYTLSADSVTFDAGDTSATFTVTAADDTDNDDGESITIGFGTLPDRVIAASPDSTTVSLVDNDNSPAQGDPLPRGEREVDATLTADTSGITDADGLTDPIFTYQWQRVDGGAPAEISGETSDTYTLTVDDFGKRIQLQVRFTDDDNYPETRTGPATSLIVREPRLLVGNLGHTASPTFTRSNVSTGFVTGAHPLGYTIDEFRIQRYSGTTVSSGLAEFRLHTSTSRSDPLDRLPGARIITVSGPDNVSGGVLTFDMPSKVKLSPGATYHVALTTSTGEHIGCFTAPDGEDSGSLAGFDIIDRNYGYPDPSTVFFPGKSCRFQINGFELVSSSFVEKVEFTSSPALAGMFATGEVIEATATLSEAVTFAEPSPVLLLQIGANEREMTYVASASTATSWVFRYTVAAGDRDDDGVPLERNALQGYADADLSHRGIGDDEARHVNAAPRIVSRQVSSRPVAPNWYGPGEHIQFTVEFSLPVTVVGDPQLEFNVTTPGPQSEFASYLRGSGTTELVFSYTVGAGDDDPDGIFLGPDSLRLDSDDSITGVYNGLDAVLDHSRAGALTRHKIDQNPRAVSQEVTSNPTRGANSDTYGAGDAITFEVVFNQTVTVTGGPRLRFNIGSGSGDEYASYVSGSGTDTLVFSYTVLAADADTDGIYLFNDPLDYPDTATDSIVGEDNSLPAVNAISGANRAVGGHKVDGAITTGGQRANSPATGWPGITGTVQAGETLTATTDRIADEDGLTNAEFAYQWVRRDLATNTDADIEGATISTYSVTDADEGKAIKVRVTFTDDAGNEESLTSHARLSAPLLVIPDKEETPESSEARETAETPLTATIHDAPESHDGQEDFSFELRFSEEPKEDFSYKTLKDHAFTVTGGEVDGARRLVSGSNIRWEITVSPDSNADVTVVLPATTDCEADGAVCTDDGRMLSEGLELIVSGPDSRQQAANTPATGEPAISGTARVGETLTADTSGIADEDGLTNVSYSYQWVADDTDIDGATDSSYTLSEDDVGKTINVRVSFEDDAGNEESLTSAATAAARPSLTASVLNAPQSHNGSDKFTFELRFSEDPKTGFSFTTLKDHAFTVTGGEVDGARRLVSGSNIRWEITVSPDSSGDVTITLPATEACDADGAICTDDGRMLSEGLKLTVSGPSG